MFYVERDSSVTKSSSWRQTTELNSEWRSEINKEKKNNFVMKLFIDRRECNELKQRSRLYTTYKYIGFY